MSAPRVFRAKLAVRAKAEFEKVSALLRADWDPIGSGAPPDEYDSYCWRVLSLLRRQASRADIETYLRWAGEVQMGSRVPDEQLGFVLDQLMKLDVSRNPPPAGAGGE